ncbi:MAG: UDP-4-amino-4,6-dideoxy-N-acetyl-beta-L-altrosamine transaminase [Thermoguttaceae bacterium]
MAKPLLAIDGGVPVRARLLPYGRQTIDDDDVTAVTETLRSDWLTTGPKVAEFEKALAATAGTSDAVAVSTGTAALHAAMYALGVGPGDEVIVSTMTFAASANCAAFLGATPVFVDVDPDTLLIDPHQVETRIAPRTKAVVAVDYAGQPCDYEALEAITRKHGVALVDDACHALGGSYRGRPVGSLAMLNTFSFHPVKHVATGEGGAITTSGAELARRLRLFRNHGITTDFRERAVQGAFAYEMVDLGYNYRLSDIQCALGITQLAKLPASVARRQAIARQYDEAFCQLPLVNPLAVRSDVSHAYHLYVIRLELDALTADRATIFRALRAEGIGVNVHYLPVHLHPYYRHKLGVGKGLCPVAEAAYERILSLPMFPAMTDDDVREVVEAVGKVCRAYQK